MESASCVCKVRFFLYVTLLFVLIFLFIPCGSCMKDAGVEKKRETSVK